MKLLTTELCKQFPKLGETDGKQPEEVPVVAKFFDPAGSWTWYATEYDGKDTFFGYVRGDYEESGYFSLSELESIKRPFGLGIERDLYFGKHTLAEVIEKRL